MHAAEGSDAGGDARNQKKKKFRTKETRERDGVKKLARAILLGCADKAIDVSEASKKPKKVKLASLAVEEARKRREDGTRSKDESKGGAAAAQASSSQSAAAQAATKPKPAEGAPPPAAGAEATTDTASSKAAADADAAAALAIDPEERRRRHPTPAEQRRLPPPTTEVASISTMADASTSTAAPVAPWSAKKAAPAADEVPGLPAAHHFGAQEGAERHKVSAATSYAHKMTVLRRDDGARRTHELMTSKWPRQPPPAALHREISSLAALARAAAWEDETPAPHSYAGAAGAAPRAAAPVMSWASAVAGREAGPPMAIAIGTVAFDDAAADAWPAVAEAQGAPPAAEDDGATAPTTEAPEPKADSWLAAVSRKPASEATNAWEQAPRGALARGFAALQQTPPRPTTPTTPTRSAEADDALDGAGDDGNRTPRPAAASTPSRLFDSPAPPDGAAPDSPQRRPAWGGQLPPSLRAPPTPSPAQLQPSGSLADALAAADDSGQSAPDSAEDEEAHTMAACDDRAPSAAPASKERSAHTPTHKSARPSPMRRTAPHHAAGAVEATGHARFGGVSPEASPATVAMRKRLATDVSDFVEQLDAAMAPQRKSRAAVLRHVAEVVSSIWAHGDTRLYGSCFTNLDLPSSDVDVVVCGLNGDATPNPPKKSPDSSDGAAASRDGAVRRPAGRTLDEDSESEGEEEQIEGRPRCASFASGPDYNPNIVGGRGYYGGGAGEPPSTAHMRSPTPPHAAPAGVVACLQTLARALKAQPWVCELKSIETASIPVIKLLVNPAMLSPPAPLPAFNRSRVKPTARRRDDDDADDDVEEGGAVSSQTQTDDNADGEAPTWAGAIGRCDAGFLAVDISFEAPSHGGLASSRYCVVAMRRWPEAQPLMLVLKELLVQRGLNEPFTGGLSSYSLLLLIITAMLQAGVEPVVDADAGADVGNALSTPPKREAAPGAGLAARIRHSAFESDADALGFLLTFFLAFFGRYFEPARHAVSVLRGDAGIIQLPAVAGDDCSWVTPLIEDPLECTRNVARSCFGIKNIQTVFAHSLELFETQGVEAMQGDGGEEANILRLVLSY
ncbi:hypothetical protein M885DRAFT_535068 [Pelagophyceae sp. CCMP2097]|nr:hypothetical protein M885DRAFT_535068 [Pelagophyceae sp. CCMP2097]